MIAAILCLVLAAQDAAEVDRLFGRLRDASIDVREKAMRDLVNLGPDATDHIRRYVRSGDAELRSRALSILDQIRQQETLRRYLPAPRPVTLDVKDAPLSGVLEEIAKQTGEPVEAVDAAADARVTVSLEDAPLWDALEKLCASGADLTYGFEDDAIVFRGRAHPPYPAVREKGVAVWLDGITLTETNDFSGTARETFTLSLNSAWPTGVKPTSVEVRLLEVTDDTGESLIRPSHGRSMTRIPTPKGRYRKDTFPGVLQVPAKEAVRLSRIHGTLRMTFPMEFEEALIPLTSDRPSVILEGVTISVQGLQHARNACTFQLMVTQPTTGGAGGAIQVSADNAVILDGEGGSYPVTSSTQSSTWSDGRRYNYYSRVHVTLPDGRRARQIRIRIQKRWYEREIPFDFRDVPLPPRS